MNIKHTLSVIILFVCLLFTAHVNAQSWQWGRGGHGQNGEAISPATDIWGNVYTCGTYDGGNDTFGTLVLPTTSIESLTIVKYDANGNLVWGTRSQGGSAYATWISANNSGELYVLAAYGGTTTLGSFSLTSVAGSYFLAKFTPSGNVAWMKDIGGDIYVDGEVAVRNNSVYITGDFINPTITIGPYTCYNSDVTGSTTDVFVAKFDSSGNIKWLKSAGGSDFDFSTSVAITPTEHVYIAGYFSSPTLPFGSTTLPLTGIPSWPIANDASYFLAKYDSSGNTEWATSPTGQACPFIANTNISVAADNTENPVVTGILFELTTLSFGSYTLNDPYFNSYTFLARYSPDGTPLWAKEVHGTNSWNSSLGIDACNNIWLGVGMENSDTVDGHIIPEPSGTVEPMMLAYFNSSGTFITSATSPTGGDDQSGIGVDAIGNVYIGGDFYFGGGFTFGSDYLVDPTGNEGLFAAKYRISSPDTTFLRSDSCISDSALVAAPSGFSTYLWCDGNINPLRTVYDSGTYWVYCTGKCGAGVTIDTFKLTHGGFDTIYKRTDTAICIHSTIILAPDNPGYTSYIWSNGSTGNTLVITSPGTYFAIAAGNCTLPSVIDTFKVIQNNTDLSFSLGADTTSCIPLTLNIPVQGGSYRWQDGSVSPSYTVTQSGIYYATVTESGCSYTDTVKIDIPVLSQHFDDTILCKENPIQFTLKASTPPGANILWSNGTTQPTVTITTTGQYWIKVSDTPCSATDSFTVSTEYCDCNAVMPTAFTPNGDGLNDSYHPIFDLGCNITDYSFSIYNRWGQRVFYTQDPAAKWDGQLFGTQAELGVYMYYVKYIAGTESKQHLLKGDVTLVR